MKNVNYDRLIEPIVSIYRNVETRLLIKIASAFKQYEDINLGNSMQWYLKKIEELGGLNSEAVDIISKYSNIPKKEVIATLKKAGYSIDLDLINKANDSGLLSIDVDKLLESERVNEVINNSYKEINETFRMIQTKSTTAFDEAYMNVLNETYTSVSTGAFDYNTAVSNALKDLASKGITVASYVQKDGKIRNYSIEATVRRDVLTAVVQNGIRGQLEIAKEMGAEYVETSEHIGARDTGTHDYKDHSYWQGKVYKLEGSTKEYPNFQECCNFGDVQGIGGANCRHSIRPFIPGISEKRSIAVDDDENKKQYELFQQQKAYERKIREIKRNIEMGKASNDKEKIKKYNDKFEEVNKEYNDFCSKNNLKRHYENERILEQYAKPNKNDPPYEDITEKMINKDISNIKEPREVFEYYKRNEDGTITVFNKDNSKFDSKGPDNDELSTIHKLKNEYGFDIDMLHRIDKKGERTPDIRNKLEDLEYWDIKGIHKAETENSRKNKISHAISEAKGQTVNVVIDLNRKDCNLTNEEALKQIDYVFKNRHYNWLEKLIIFGKDNSTKYFKRK